jgi:hypothetical protein
MGGLHGRPSLLHVSISILLPVVWQKCAPAHRTGVWAAAPRVEPSGPYTAVHSINDAGKGCPLWPILLDLRSQVPCRRCSVGCSVLLHVVRRPSHRRRYHISTPPALTRTSFFQCCNKPLPPPTIERTYRAFVSLCSQRHQPIRYSTAVQQSSSPLPLSSQAHRCFRLANDISITPHAYHCQ